ncbi:MAG TPA: PilZ domain-containing protein [Anaeromyxobacteraceae bacterium]|nr:PilZ domain-containing protein [Anaeromyxobacteraceae bacterium]
MADFVFNPRRAPRAPVRCRAEIAGTDGERWVTETEDVGPRGCQIVAPRRRPLGERLQISVSADGLARKLRVDGKVAWVSAAEPWRHGVAFAESDARAAVEWYEALVAKTPALAAYRGVPERLSLDATLFLGPPPRLVDFTNEEVQVLRCVGTGISVGDLRQRLGAIWGRAQHALFSLIVRRHVVLARGASVLPNAWKEILSALETTLAVEDLERSSRKRPLTPPPVQRAPTPPPAIQAIQPAPPPRAAPTPPPPPAAPPAAVAGVPAPRTSASRETRASMRAIDAGGAWSGSEPRHDFEGAGVGWRTQPRPRSPEADGIFRRATLEAEAGKVESAIGLLRQALHLSPGDPEIAALLGRLAFRDRTAPPR